MTPIGRKWQLDGGSGMQASAIRECINHCSDINDILSASRALLKAYQANLTFNDPNVESTILVQHAFEKTSLQLITQSDELAGEVGKKHLARMLSQRIAGHPLAYIVGHQPFWTLDLKVSENTLIPRADSEIVVETAISLGLSKNANILDLGTGTGAIALAIKAERPHWIITGCDFKKEIVALATHNAQFNNLDVAFILSDWFAAIAAKPGFDLIVSNPPYVESDSVWLQQGDVRFEPSSALTSGIDGLDDIRHIISNATAFLNDGGYLLLEHGHQQAHIITPLMQENGFTDVVTKQDLNGLDRATLGRWIAR